MRRWLKNFFCIFIVKKILETLTISGDFTGNRIRISSSGGSSKRIGNLNTALEKVNSQSSACDFEK